jgi:hypothetical protein
MIRVISESDVMDSMQDELIQTAFTEGFLDDEHLVFDATNFESRDASKPSEKRQSCQQKNVDVNQKKNKLLGSPNKQKSRRIKRRTK